MTEKALPHRSTTASFGSDEDAVPDVDPSNARALVFPTQLLLIVQILMVTGAFIDIWAIARAPARYISRLTFFASPVTHI